jgi:hypothetical protein
MRRGFLDLIMTLRGAAAAGLIVAMCHAQPDSAALQIAATKHGVSSEVHLLAVSHLPPRALKSAAPARGGLRLVFLAVSRLPGKPVFMMQELRDFSIGGQSYRVMTAARLGTPLEPHTYTVNTEVLVKLDASVGRFLKPGTSEATGMIVDIAGAQLPARGKAQVLVRVGWNDRLETFSFDIDLAKVPRATAFTPYAGGN